jgi:hypothetical protein
LPLIWRQKKSNLLTANNCRANVLTTF